MDLSTQGRLQPLPLSPPILALLLFINESTKAIEDPTTALPVSVKDALWMEAAAALMAWLVLSFGTRQNRPQTPSRTSTRLSGMLAAATIVGGMAYFLRNHCDISRLLVVLGIGAWVFQKILDKARIRQ